MTYRVGKKALFEDVNIKFTEGNCYGLIGAFSFRLCQKLFMASLLDHFPFMEDQYLMDAIVEAAKDGPFLSKDDFRQRTKTSKTVVDMMDNLNLLGNLPF